MEIREIPFAPFYEVSDTGNIYSRKYGERRQMAPWSHKYGYGMVCLRVGGISKRVTVHRLVALVFVGSPDTPDLEVRHRDGNPKNNASSNLEWGTHRENMGDMVKHGNQGAYRHPERVPRGIRSGRHTHPESTPRGENHVFAVLTEKIVRAARAMKSDGVGTTEISRRLGVTRNSINQVLIGRSWRHV